MFHLVAIAAIAAMQRTPEFKVTYSKVGHIEVELDARVDFSLAFSDVGPAPRANVTSEPASPMFLGYPHGPKTGDWAPRGATKHTLSFSVGAGQIVDVTVGAGRDSFSCSDRENAPLTSTFGGAVSTLDNAVYDRGADWLLSSDADDVRISRSGDRYRLVAHGPGTVTIRPDYYRDHRGYFLWNRKRRLWPKPVAGWCSWAAYGQDVNESEVERAAAFFGRTLLPYGFNVIQIDDGYQRVLQLTDKHQPITEPFADYWTKPNEKFPSGMKALATRIAACGMTPGIWVGLYLPLGLTHAKSYVTGADGKPLQGPWVGYSMDSGNADAVREAYTDALTTFRQEGWRYFKIDTLRHVLYDSYRRVPAYWEARHTDSSHAFRRLFESVRKAVGTNNYLLACWGALPELAGLPDGCRIGEDVGPSFASMRRSAKYIAQFHYANNVIWRNDPDYMCFRVSPDQCRTWATLTSLTGGHVMVSDPIETYDTERVNILRRVGPPVVIEPGNAQPLPPDPEWLTFHGAKGRATWTVAGRLAWRALPAANVPVADLGLKPETTYLAWDFWSRRLVGKIRGEAPFEALEPGSCQVVGFRPATGEPQVLGDDRHVAQGALELADERFHGSTLSGRFLSTGDRPWSLFLYVPAGWRFTSASLAAKSIGANVVELVVPPRSDWIRWNAEFAQVR